jgi:hypothetical protein
MAELALHKNQEKHLLAANLRRVFLLMAQFYNKARKFYPATSSGVD